ncbi:MAG: hypothetical protein AABZ30_13970 [Myxococcota bacterium]
MLRGKSVVIVLGIYAWAVLAGMPVGAGSGFAATFAGLAPLALLALGVLAPPQTARAAFVLLGGFPLALLGLLAWTGAGAVGALEATLGAIALCAYMAAASRVTAPCGGGTPVDDDARDAPERAAPHVPPPGVSHPRRLPALARTLAPIALAAGGLLALPGIAPSAASNIAHAFPGHARTAQAVLVALGALLAIAAVSAHLVPAARAAVRDDAAHRALFLEATADVAAKTRWEAWAAAALGLAALGAWLAR